MSQHHGAVWWTELMTRDLQGAKEFYTSTCGWSIEAMPMPGGEGEYWIGSKDGVPTVGMMDISGMPGLEDVPPHWFSYFAVDDVDAAVEATKAAGGQVMREPWDLPGTGRIAMITDPTGAAVGLMTPAPEVLAAAG